MPKYWFSATKGGALCSLLNSEAGEVPTFFLKAPTLTHDKD